jgi:hypothetical protein
MGRLHGGEHLGCDGRFRLICPRHDQRIRYKRVLQPPGRAQAKAVSMDIGALAADAHIVSP